jgi:metacaspase-1
MSKKALCIGINDYPGAANDLSGCVNDTNDWVAELTACGFVVQKLLDSMATKAAMMVAVA